MSTLSRFVGLNGIVLVKANPKERLTKTGLIIVDAGAGKRTKPVSGVVMKVCDDEKRIKAGDTVYYHEGLATEVILDDTPYLLLRDVDLKFGLRAEVGPQAGESLTDIIRSAAVATGGIV